MATITHDGLLVCQDCTMLIANGGFDGDCEHGQATDHAMAIAEQWGLDSPWPVLDSEEHDFSTHRCDGCGSTLAGYRHAAVVLSN